MIEFLITYAFSFVGTPYRYGGNTPLDGGMDCSGYVQEILKAGGVLKNSVDMSAQALYDYLRNTPQTKFLSPGLAQAGAISFYGKSPKQIEHVGFCLDDKLMISAAGGSSKTISFEDAMTARAFIKPRPINYRNDLIAIYLPDY